MKQRVLVGMSGGVDSSVTAKILLEKGYEVVGVTIKMFENADEKGHCTAIDDAKKVAERLGIIHYVKDFTKEFKEHVLDYFTDSYLNGQTPNPCIQCNKFIKFGKMLEFADELGCDKIATGHYAQIKYENETDMYYLVRAKDISKDQTYFLYSLTQHQLSRTLFPLYDTDKNTVRKIAKEIGLSVHDKPDSQDICFITNCHYTDYIKSATHIIPKTGDFVNVSGLKIGVHSGLINYTIGQRKGLGMTFNKPMFVIKKNSISNNVVLGEENDLYSSSLIAENINISAYENIKSPLSVTAKIRYSQSEQSALLTMLDAKTARVDFTEKQRAVTDGQAVVFYKDEICLGGGTIASSL